MEIAVDVTCTVVAIVVALSGLSKLTSWFGFGGPTATVAGFQALGLRGGRLAVLGAGAVQVGGGLLLLAGLATPIAAMAVTGVMVVALITQLPRGLWVTRVGRSTRCC